MKILHELDANSHQGPKWRVWHVVGETARSYLVGRSPDYPIERASKVKKSIARTGVEGAFHTEAARADRDWWDDNFRLAARTVQDPRFPDDVTRLRGVVDALSRGS